MPTEHVSLWHPWYDKPGIRHTLHLWEEFSSLPIEEIINQVGENKYAFCNDILNEREVSTSLLNSKESEPYLSRTGHVSALRIRSKRKSGFLIPGIQWGCDESPGENLLASVGKIFRIFNLEALTPSSLSEKVLRSTLSPDIRISRPSIPLRATFLANKKGGRVFHRTGRYQEAYEYDAVKKYLSIASQGVPSPFISPVRFCGSNLWERYPISWLQATFRAHVKPGIMQPVQLPGGIRERDPENLEVFTSWMWNGELEDCIEAGYDLLEVHQGWCWPYLSSFMSQWADILFNAYDKERNEDVRAIMKIMMVGLPGRFQKEPEIYTLVHISEFQPGDIPLARQIKPGESPNSDWFMRVDKESERARETAQLTPIGHYIVTQGRRELYRDSKQAQERGCTIIRCYVDSITVDRASSNFRIGTRKGDYKVKHYSRVTVKRNRFYGELVDNRHGVLKAPACTGEEREKVRKELIWDSS